jgi:transposase-like protein
VLSHFGLRCCAVGGIWGCFSRFLTIDWVCMLTRCRVGGHDASHSSPGEVLHPAPESHNDRSEVKASPGRVNREITESSKGHRRFPSDDATVDAAAVAQRLERSNKEVADLRRKLKQVTTELARERADREAVETDLREVLIALAESMPPPDATPGSEQTSSPADPVVPPTPAAIVRCLADVKERLCFEVMSAVRMTCRG